MKKLITSAEVCVGDVLQMKLDGGPSDRATVIGKTGKGKVVRLQLEPPPETGVGPVWIEGLASEELILIRRPRPEGKTEEYLLQQVDVALRRCVHATVENDGRSIGAYAELTPYTAGREEALRSLREVIEEYELDKVEEPKRNETLLDRDRTS